MAVNGHQDGTNATDDHPKNIIVDGVLRYPPTGQHIIIVGAGPGGFLAALECWRKGYEVTVLEKAPELVATGDVVGLSPAAVAALKHYPSMLPGYDKIQIDALMCCHHLDGRLAFPAVEFEYNGPGLVPHAAFPLRVGGFIRRSELVLLMRDQAEKFGIKVVMDTAIVDYEEDADSATAIAADGRRFKGDIVVAADGIGTKSHKAVLGRSVRAITSGVVAYRGLYSTQHLHDAPNIKKWLAKGIRDEVRIYTDTGMHCIIVLTKSHITVALVVKESAGGKAMESWSNTVTTDEVLATIEKPEDWDPIILEAIRNAPPNTIVCWQLCMRNPQLRWASPQGRVIQLGDAAHSFLSTSGNGAVQAMEDAPSLAECLRLGGKDGLVTAARVHELLRYERVTLIQRTGFVNRRQLHRPMSEIMQDPTGVMQFGKWMWTHNTEQYATDNFAKARAHLETGAPFENTNLPPGHKFEHWTMEEEMVKEDEALKLGTFVQDLKLNGDWSVL